MRCEGEVEREIGLRKIGQRVKRASHLYQASS